MKPRRGKGLPWPDACYYVGLEATRTITKPHISFKGNAWHSLPHTSSCLPIVGLQSLMARLQHIQIRASSLQCLPDERHQRLRERRNTFRDWQSSEI